MHPLTIRPYGGRWWERRWEAAFHAPAGRVVAVRAFTRRGAERRGMRLYESVHPRLP